MAKRTSRLAWGLIFCLAAIVLMSAGQLLTDCAQANSVHVVCLPIGQWHFGWQSIEIGGCFGTPMITVGESIGFGPLEVSWPNRLRRAWLR